MFLDLGLLEFYQIPTSAIAHRRALETPLIQI